MALNIIKCLNNNKNKIHLIQSLRNLSPIIAEKKRFMSTDKAMVESNEVKDFELKSKQRMKEKVLDRKTHTGQTFTENDYRLLRFEGKEKEINPRFAIDLIAEEPPIASKERWARCDGGGGPLGHPMVFINLDDPGEYGTCGYCGLRFYKEGHSHH